MRYVLTVHKTFSNLYTEPYKAQYLESTTGTQLTSLPENIIWFDMKNLLPHQLWQSLWIAPPIPLTTVLTVQFILESVAVVDEKNPQNN